MYENVRDAGPFHSSSEGSQPAADKNKDCAGEESIMKTGLVMEGGAMRGMFTCGVIDVFMENDIWLDAAVGVSAGAAFGCNYKSRQIGRPIRYNKAFCSDKRYAGIHSLITTGNLFNVEFCYHTIPYELDKWDGAAFAANPMAFYCVATDVRTGKPVYRRLKEGGEEDIKWIRASASIPAFSKPVEIDGGLYLDGGTADSIPLKFMEHLKAEKIVVIETQPVDYVKQPQKYMRILKVSLRKYPAMIRALERRYRMYNREKAYVRSREEEGAVFVIRPEAPLTISSFKRTEEDLERVYQAGRKAAAAALPKLREYLNS